MTPLKILLSTNYSPKKYQQDLALNNNQRFDTPLDQITPPLNIWRLNELHETGICLYLFLKNLFLNSFILLTQTLTQVFKF